MSKQRSTISFLCSLNVLRQSAIAGDTCQHPPQSQMLAQQYTKTARGPSFPAPVPRRTSTRSTAKQLHEQPACNLQRCGNSALSDQSPRRLTTAQYRFNLSWKHLPPIAPMTDVQEPRLVDSFLDWPLKNNWSPVVQDLPGECEPPNSSRFPKNTPQR